MRADLHSHSTASDGTSTPADVMRRARAAGLDVIALTDHDTVAGHDQARSALPPGLTLVPGMELSCRLAGHSVHLLGYLFDPADPEFLGDQQHLSGAAHRVRAGHGHGAAAGPAPLVARAREPGDQPARGQRPGQPHRDHHAAQQSFEPRGRRAGQRAQRVDFPVQAALPRAGPGTGLA